MSDLQCAARILVARHAEADSETETLAGDGGSLTALGRSQSAELAESLAGERVAHVYVSSRSRAVQTGEIVAARLGVGVTVREALRELEARIAAGDSAAEVITRIGGVLQEIADAHRGEAWTTTAGSPGDGRTRTCRRDEAKEAPTPVGTADQNSRWLGSSMPRRAS